MSDTRQTDLAEGTEPTAVAATVEVTINGAGQILPRGITVADLIVRLGLGDRRVAVERNRDVVPKSDHASCVILAGDTLELVTFVGGG